MKSDITGKAKITINTSADKVWAALTQPEIIKKYFFGTDVVSDWKPGSHIYFRGEWKGKKYEDKGVILDVEPNKLFRYKYWSSMSGIEDKPENYVNITYELKEENNGTTLFITQENIPTPEMREHSEQNWNKVLQDLKKLLEKGQATYT